MKRVLHLASTFIQARRGCTTTPPSLAPSPLKLGGGPPPPPALLVSSSCTTHHPFPQKPGYPPPPAYLQTMGDAPPPPAVPIHGAGGCTTAPPPRCPAKVGGCTTSPPSCAHPMWRGVHHPPTSTPSRGGISFVHFKIDSGEEE